MKKFLKTIHNQLIHVDIVRNISIDENLKVIAWTHHAREKYQSVPHILYEAKSMEQGNEVINLINEHFGVDIKSEADNETGNIVFIETTDTNHIIILFTKDSLENCKQVLNTHDNWKLLHFMENVTRKTENELFEKFKKHIIEEVWFERAPELLEYIDHLKTKENANAKDND